MHFESFFSFQTTKTEDSNTFNTQRIQLKLDKVNIVQVKDHLIQKGLPLEVTDALFDYSNINFFNLLMI